MSTQLMRTALVQPYRDATDAHPGLLIQRGYEAYDQESDTGRQRKTSHIARICAIPASPYYTRAYLRWVRNTSNDERFIAVELALQTRLFIGLTGGGMLETGCAVSHSYGMPYIPGSSIKGVTTAWVRQTGFASAENNAAVCDALFGGAPSDAELQGLGGTLAFHDAWWIPEPNANPFVPEVVTTHHLDYYGSQGGVAATDLDSPIPNAQIAIAGRFRFLLEGPTAWLPLAKEMLTDALVHSGVGAKTRAGNGLFRPIESSRSGTSGPTCAWVDETIARLMQENRAQQDDTLRGKGLATAWQALTDTELKAAARADIQARWEERGWWEQPPGNSARKAKAIYTAE